MLPCLYYDSGFITKERTSYGSLSNSIIIQILLTNTNTTTQMCFNELQARTVVHNEAFLVPTQCLVLFLGYVYIRIH